MIEYPAFIYSWVRSKHFGFQYSILSLFSRVWFRMDQGAAAREPGAAKRIERELIRFLREDSRNIARGIYPLSVLKPESPFRHVGRVPWLLWDSVSIYRRRKKGRTAVFSSQAKEFLPELPRYYRRNFHFQTSGYLSERSAQLYEHQVEALFGGAADAMRRLIIPPLKQKFRGAPQGEGLTFLEVGAGTGRATHFVHLAFPKAKIIGVDLSEHYLREARKKLLDDARVHFIQGDGGALPFGEGVFDAVYSVFLFHELPLAARKEVIAESRRVLKAGGVFGLVDSIQFHDEKEFKSLLEGFPKEYHEPFYRDYVSRPMEDLLKVARLRKVTCDRGFFSKVCVARK